MNKSCSSISDSKQAQVRSEVAVCFHSTTHDLSSLNEAQSLLHIPVILTSPLQQCSFSAQQQMHCSPSHPCPPSLPPLPVPCICPSHSRSLSLTRAWMRQRWSWPWCKHSLWVLLKADIWLYLPPSSAARSPPGLKTTSRRRSAASMWRMAGMRSRI